MVTNEETEKCTHFLNQWFPNFFKSWYVENDNTYTQVNLLNDNEHVIEVAKLISGNDVSEASISAAKELIGNK